MTDQPHVSSRPLASVPSRSTEADSVQRDASDRLRHAVQSVLGHVFVEGNRIDVLRNGRQIFPPMLEAIEQSQRTIDFVTFVYWTGDIARQFAHALAARARSGVRVRVILDGFGSLPMRDDLIEEMRTAGVVVERFRPIVRWKFWESDHRTHRKILVCDETVGFTGGVGIAEEWEGDARNPTEWRDTHFRVEGPAVLGLRAAFLTDWRDMGHAIDIADIDVSRPEKAGEVALAVVDGSAQIGYNDAERVLEGLVAAARTRIRIQTPYFNPTDELLDLLVAAKERGVDIDILLPGPHIDKRVSAVVAEQRYAPLLRKGIRVALYQPTMMHVKAVTVDGAIACVGSVNINQRSVEKDEEVALLVLDTDLVATIDEQFAEDLEVSVPVRPDRDLRPRVARRVAAALLRPIRREL